MKNKKQITIYMDQNLFDKIKEIAKSDKSINKIIIDLIDKGLSKNRNDYNELINFLSKNIVTKINKEFTDYRYFLRKFLLNSSSVIPPAQNNYVNNKPADEPKKPENFFDKLK